MTKIKNRDEALSRCRIQYEQTKLYAQYWMAMATTGTACLRDVSQGRTVTEEEKAQGEVIGWTPLTDQEKIKRALDTSMVHIQRLGPLGEVIIALEIDDPERYYNAIKEGL